MMPPRSILAAVDFSEPSRVALEFAARLANQCRASLHVLHVEDPLLAAAAKAHGIDLTRESRDELARFTAASPAARDWTPLHHHILGGQATSAICGIAEREQVDVIVLGMHGMSGPARALFGSTTEGVVQHAGRSVFVIPDSWEPPRPSTRDLSGIGPVIAAVESSCSALAGVAAAAKLAETLRTTVGALHVVPERHVLDRWRQYADAVAAQQIADARAEIGVALAGVRSNVAIALRVETGSSVAEQIAAAADAAGRHAILVLGRHARDGRRGVPGAMAYRLLGHAKVPVLVYCLAEGCP